MRMIRRDSELPIELLKPHGLWKPNDKGLGLRHVFDTLNGIYGDDFIRYE